MRQKLARNQEGHRELPDRIICLKFVRWPSTSFRVFAPRSPPSTNGLSGDLREDVVGAVEQGASKLDDYLIVAISSEGTVRNGSGDTIKMELADILKGEYLAPHVSIWHYKLDELEEVADPAMWLKANPNLGLDGHL